MARALRGPSPRARSACALRGDVWALRAGGGGLPAALRLRRAGPRGLLLVLGHHRPDAPRPENNEQNNTEQKRGEDVRKRLPGLGRFA